MLEAWLAGDVPDPVMADWCEERGLLFPRPPLSAGHRTRTGRIAGSVFRVVGRRAVQSTSAHDAEEYHWSGSGESLHARTLSNEQGCSWSGSRTRSRPVSLSRSRRMERDRID